ncbi:hypothetical protein GGI12_004030 [Dipsacomyces acuminosporus]|nr:hypothetical protein GGI12_004030 [Dipsacomyces acuminosporus]
MAHTQQRSIKYIVIHERSPGLPVLYTSRSRQQFLSYLLESPAGGTPLPYITSSRDRAEIKRCYGSQTDNNVILTNFFTKSKYDEDVLVRGITFACGTVGLAMITAYINVARTQDSSNAMTTQKYKYILRNNDSRVGVINSIADGGNANGMYSMKSTYQACFVLEEMSTSSLDGDTGPKIVFITDSINRILDTDSCDLQGLPFLDLVAIEDKEKAAAFLEKTLNDNELVLERLHLLVNPLEDSQTASPKCVSVEFMAMGSDDGAVVLCQLERPWIAGRNENVGYMSLEDIISSDPETSDFPDLWNVMEPY